jgi:hypothetical protein
MRKLIDLGVIDNVCGGAAPTAGSVNTDARAVRDDSAVHVSLSRAAQNPLRQL